MRPAPPTGDLALTARPATADTFAPFGRLLALGEHVQLGAGGGVVTSLEAVRPGPRRFTHLQRLPDARRLVLPLGELSLLVVVLAKGDPAPGPPAAFRTAPGYGVLIDAGVWHAGPVPLDEGSVCELLETHGDVDHLDQQPVAELTGVEGIRVQLADEPGAAGPSFDLDVSGAVLVEDGLDERLAVGLLLLEGLDVAAESLKLDEASRAAADGVRSLVGPGRSPAGALGVTAIRRLWRSWAVPREVKPFYEILLQDVLDGHPVTAPDTLRGAIFLCSLRRQVAASVHDAAHLVGPLQLRAGRRGESLEDEGGRSLDTVGVPVLCDRDGAFAGPLGTAPRVRVGPGVHRALVVLYLPPGTDEGDTLAHLEEASRVVREFCGGREAGRLVI